MESVRSPEKKAFQARLHSLLEDTLAHANRESLAQFQAAHPKILSPAHALYPIQLLALVPPIRDHLALHHQPPEAIRQVLMERPSLYLKRVGNFIRPRSVRTSLTFVVNRLLGDANYFRDAALYNEQGMLVIVALVSCVDIAVLFEWNGVHDRDERVRLLLDALNQCPFVVVRGALAWRLSPRERVVAQLRRLLQRGPTDAELHDLYLGNQEFVLQQLLQHSSMADLCDSDTETVTALLSEQLDMVLRTDPELGPIVQLRVAAEAEVPPSPPPSPLPSPLATLRTISADNPVDLNVLWMTKHYGNFSVLSYNILSPALVGPAKYRTKEELTLDWGVRCHRIYSEIRSSAASVVCLMELQAAYTPGVEDVATSVREVMKGLGYDYVLAENYRAKGVPWVHAVAIFYRRNVFTLVEGRSYSAFQDFTVKRLTDYYSRGYFCSPHAFAVARLVHKNTQKPVTIAAVHVPRACNASTRQIEHIKQIVYLQAVLDTVSQGFPQAPVIVCGDFNSEMGDPPLELMTKGLVTEWPAPSTPSVKLPYAQFSHALQLKSAYDPVPELTNVRGAIPPKFTNFFAGTIDYIFASPGLRVTTTLYVPPVGKCIAEGGLPNDRHPSDHLPVGAAFEFV